MSKNVLVVVAHPDDEILGCGGTICKHVKAGDRVSIIVLADGITSRDNSSSEERVKAREQEFYQAVETLGVKKENCLLLGLPDQKLDTLPLLDIVKKIENITAQEIPELVYTHHFGDLNKDHRICCEAVLVALRPTREGTGNMLIYSFEIPGNMGVLPPLVSNKFVPDHFVDIADQVQTKIKAFERYKDELRDYPNPLSTQALLELAAARAKKPGLKYAEAFVCIRKPSQL